jgi:hypothetical protein
MHYVYEIAIGPKKQIGSTSYIQKRMNKHLRELIKNSHWNSYMQNAYNKYLIFNYSILSSWKTREEAFIEEQRLLDNFFGKENYTLQSKKAIGASPDSEYLKYWKGIKNTEKLIKILNLVFKKLAMLFKLLNKYFTNLKYLKLLKKH